MALKISDSRSFKLEPMKKNRFVYQFTSVPGNTGGEEELAFVCKSATIPSITFGDVSFRRMNEMFKVAGSPTWNDLQCAFYDFIRNSNTSNDSAGDIMYNWSAIIYNPLTGQQGYKTQYATSGTLAQLDPPGNVVRAWNMFSMFPSNITFGESVGYEDEGLLEIGATFKYDIAIKAVDAKVSGKSA